MRELQTPLGDDARRHLRDALGWFATGVTIVTTCAENGERIGITANSFNSVSLDPPLVLFSLDRRAYSLPVFERAGRFAVNVLDESQADLSSRFARPSGDKWNGTPCESGLDGCPVLSESLAVFECETHACHDGGDHVIFIGRVRRLRVRDDGRPLLFARGRYGRLAEFA